MEFAATRLAPSPTGALHLGHARTFLIAWWMARQAGAKILMRMEDLDAGRAKARSVQQAYDDLRWLGMDWDAYGSGGDVAAAEVEDGIVVQSRRMGRYATVLGELAARGAVYLCTCTRADVAAAVERSGNAPHEGEGEVRYPGTCRKDEKQKTQDEGVLAWARQVIAETGKPVCFRLRVPEGRVEFEDLLAGRQGFDVAGTAGDFPVTRFWNGSGPIPPAYQLACVVDDAAMEISEVVRGEDLLRSTARQWLLYEALGLPRPAFFHCPLLRDERGERLAKRHDALSLRQLRNEGKTPEALRGFAVTLSGVAADRSSGT